MVSTSWPSEARKVQSQFVSVLPFSSVAYLARPELYGLHHSSRGCRRCRRQRRGRHNRHVLEEQIECCRPCQECEPSCRGQGKRLESGSTTLPSNQAH